MLLLVICEGFLNSRRFSYSRIFYFFLVLIAKLVVATLHLHYLGQRTKYGNLEVGNTPQQLLSTTQPCCSIAFIESFLFSVILVAYNIGIYICICIYKMVIFILFFIFNCNVFSALDAEINEIAFHCILRYEKIFCEIDE